MRVPCLMTLMTAGLSSAAAGESKHLQELVDDCGPQKFDLGLWAGQLL
jgi:hypothetical protein